MAIAACLSTFMKFDGVFTLQAKGDGLVRTLFADINDAGHLRGYCAFDDDACALSAVTAPLEVSGAVPLGAIMGDGYIAFTVDESNTGGRYQGIVELDQGGLDAAAIRWFENSEQLDTSVICAAGEGPDGWRAVALMLQRVAAEGGQGAANMMADAAARAASDDAWHTAKTLMASITRDELLDPSLTPEDIVFRLFNSMAPHSAPARPVLDQCRCSTDKIEAMLRQLEPQELDDLADESGELAVTCEFCKTARRFHKDRID
jgi:molecular chaperone Hsp33